MSTEESAISHLAQSDLEGDDEDILAGLEAWLSTAQFKEQGDEWELCTDRELPEKWKLLKKMNLAQKFTEPGYSIARVPGPMPSRFKNTGGPFYMTPIRILSGSPTVEGLPLSTARTTYVDKNKSVNVTPALYVLFIVTREKESVVGGVKE